MAAPTLIPGQSLGHFRLIEQIGSGGMGVVYRARDTSLERDVAIKVLNARTLNETSSRKQFRGEALILSRLNHPNVEAVYEFRSEEDIDFLVLEYVPGTTLNELLQRGPLAEKQIINLGLQLARGLAAAHSQRVLHRDLKPGNLRVTPDHVLKILDFGLSELFALPDDETLTEAEAARNTRAGTPAYLSPEQIQGREPDTRSDIYSAGVVLYELATGSKPFRQGGQMLVEAILHSLPPAPRLKNSEISPGLEAVILRCLEKDPNLRYQTATDLQKDFERLATGLDSTISGFHPHIWNRGAAGSRTTWMVIGACILLLAAIAGVLLWKPWQPGAIEQKVLAVLPMDTVGQDPATTALGLGLTETVTAKLSQASDRAAIQVVSPKDLRDQGVKTAEDARRQFGTDLVLESSLQRSGQNTRINCYLVDSKTHRQLDAKTIEADTTDAFGLQDRVVSAVVDMLPNHLTAAERRKLNVVQNTQPAAYEAYIRGRGYLQEYEKPENIENAIVEFNQAIKVDPNYALAYAGLGEAYWQQYDRFDKGTPAARQALQNCEKARSLKPDLVEAHICLGNTLNGTGKYENAVEEFKRAVEENPQSTDALRGLADAYEKTGNVSAAEATYKQAIDLRPGYWGTYHALGLFYYRQARYTEASEIFQKEIQLAPDNYLSYTALGGVNITLGNYDKAIEAFQHSIDLRPRFGAYTNLGYTYYLMHRFPEAIKAHEQALKFNENNWEPWGNLADALYWSSTRRPEAATDYKRAAELASSKLQLNPKDARAMVYLGGFLAMLGRRDESLLYAQKAVREQPTDSEVVFRAAVICNQLGETEQALSYLKKAVDLGYPKHIIKDTPEFQTLQRNPQFKTYID